MMMVRPFLCCRVVGAFLVPTTRLSSRIPKRFASTVLYEASQQKFKGEPDFPEGRPLQNQTMVSGLRRANQPSFYIQASATSNRIGTGVGVLLVGSCSKTAATQYEREHNHNVSTNNTTTTSFGVYFRQHRSLYECEYTALIVALQCLRTNHVFETNNQPMITLLIRQDLVYYQLLGDYPIEKESLKFLNRIAIDLIQASNLEIRLELCPKVSAPFQVCNDLASRVLLTERSDQGFDAFADPLDPYSSATAVEEELVELEDRREDDDDNAAGFNLVLESSAENDATLEEFDAPMESDAEQALPSERQTRPEIDPNRTYLLQFDGGARGNPGPSGCGMVIYDEERKEIWSGAKYLGVNMTNNQAEYTGIVLGLQHANAMGIRKLLCQGDSQLIIQQLKGQYKVKNEGLKPYYQAATEAMREFDYFEANHIVRKDNAVADSLANQAMDYKSSFGF